MSLHARTCPSVLLTLFFSPPPPPQFFNSVHPTVAEVQGTQKYIDPTSCRDRAEDRHFLCTQGRWPGEHNSYETPKNPPSHPKPIRKPSCNAPAATDRLLSCTSPRPSPPKRLLHQTPLLSPPKSHSIGVSSWCFTRELGCEHSPAKHPQGPGSSRCPGAREGRRQGRGRGSVHTAGAKLNVDPYFYLNVLFSFCFNHLSPKPSSDETLLHQVAGKWQLKYQPSPVPV